MPRAQYGTAWVLWRSLHINGLSVITTTIVHLYLRLAGWRAVASSWAGDQQGAKGGKQLGKGQGAEALPGTQQQQQQQQQPAGSRSSEEESCRKRRGGTALQGGQEEVLGSGGCLGTTGAHLDAEEQPVAGSAATSSAAATLHAGSRGMAEEDGGRSGALRGRWRRPCGVDRNAPLLTWLWQMLQLVVGWRDDSQDEAARYQAFTLPTMQRLASVMWVPAEGTWSGAGAVSLAKHGCRSCSFHCR